jgi:hypothetical protein
MEKLKPCPFCGGSLKNHELGDYRGVSCKCEKCELVIEGYWSDSAISFAKKVNARAALATLTADRGEAMVGAVTVKPLEWVENVDTCLDCALVDTFGLYEITEDAVLFSGHCSTGQRHSTIEAAKAAAQVDFTARILATIQTAPDTVTEVREVLAVKTSGRERQEHSRVGHTLAEASWHVHLAGFRCKQEADAALALLTKDG